MNLQEIRDIIEREGAKVVIVENDRPVLIISAFEEYAKKWEQPATYDVPEPTEPPVEELTIDDLPL